MTRENTQKKSMSLVEEKYIQSKRMPITLVEILPKEFLQNHSEDEMKEEVVQCCMVSIDDNEREVDEVTFRPTFVITIEGKIKPKCKI